MNPTASTFDLHGTVLRIVPHVFDTMLSLAILPGAAGPPARGERVSGTIGIAGETLSGSVYLHFSEPLARRDADGAGHALAPGRRACGARQDGQ